MFKKVMQSLKAKAAKRRQRRQRDAQIFNRALQSQKDLARLHSPFVIGRGSRARSVVSSSGSATIQPTSKELETEFEHVVAKKDPDTVACVTQHGHVVLFRGPGGSC